MNNKELALFSLGAEKYKKLEAEIIAAYIEQQAKEVPVLPEVNEEDQAWLSDNPNTGDVVEYVKTYASGYGQQCAAHAREVALEEAKREAVKRHSAGEVGAVLISKAIEALKKVGK